MPIQVQVVKWGNGLGVPVPSDIARVVGLTEGSWVGIDAAGDGQIIIGRVRRRLTLEELPAGMTPEREHALADDGAHGTEAL